MSTPNSSFILERRRRSIRLCAVLRATLRPAALDTLAPLPLAGVEAVVDPVAVEEVAVAAVGAAAEAAALFWGRGFI